MTAANPASRGRARRARLARWLPVVPLVAFLVAAHVADGVESRLFADPSRHAPTPAHPLALTLKGGVFYVTADERRTHELAGGAAFVSLALYWMALGASRRRLADLERPRASAIHMRS